MPLEVAGLGRREGVANPSIQARAAYEEISGQHRLACPCTREWDRALCNKFDLEPSSFILGLLQSGVAYMRRVTRSGSICVHSYARLHHQGWRLLMLETQASKNITYRFESCFGARNKFRSACSRNSPSCLASTSDLLNPADEP